MFVYILERGDSGRLDPTTVVHAFAWMGLRPKLRFRMPARIEKHQHGANSVPIRDCEKGVDPLQETLRILNPKEIVKIDANRIHAHRCGEGQFPIDHGQIEGARLPHLQLIDRIGRSEITPDQPRLSLEPRMRRFRRPTFYRIRPAHRFSSFPRPAAVP